MNYVYESRHEHRTFDGKSMIPCIDSFTHELVLDFIVAEVFIHFFFIRSHWLCFRGVVECVRYYSHLLLYSMHGWMTSMDSNNGEWVLVCGQSVSRYVFVFIDFVRHVILIVLSNGTEVIMWLLWITDECSIARKLQFFQYILCSSGSTVTIVPISIPNSVPSHFHWR